MHVGMQQTLEEKKIALSRAREKTPAKALLEKSDSTPFMQARIGSDRLFLYKRVFVDESKPSRRGLSRSSLFKEAITMIDKFQKQKTVMRSHRKKEATLLPKDDLLTVVPKKNFSFLCNSFHFWRDRSKKMMTTEIAFFRRGKRKLNFSPIIMRIINVASPPFGSPNARESLILSRQTRRLRNFFLRIIAYTVYYLLIQQRQKSKFRVCVCRWQQEYGSIFASCARTWRHIHTFFLSFSIDR